MAVETEVVVVLVMTFISTTELYRGRLTEQAMYNIVALKSYYSRI